MKFSKKHFVVGLIGNLLVCALGLTGIIMLMLENSNLAETMKYFTTLSNVLVTLCAFVNLILYAVSISKKKNYVKEFFQVMKLISVVAVAITFTIVMAFLAPNNTTGIDLFAGSQLFMHVITPIAAVFSFIFLEYQTKIRFRFFYFSVFFALAYGAFYISYAFLAPAGQAIDWYGFMFEAGARVAPVDLTKFTLGQFLLFLGESLGGGVVFGFVFWLLNKIMNLIFVGYTVAPEAIEGSPAQVEEPVSEEKEEPVVEEKPVEEVKEASEEPVEDVTEEVSDEPEAKEEKEPGIAEKSPAKPAPSEKPKSKRNVNYNPNKYKDGVRVYHISRSKFMSKYWQVKLAGGEKAIKIFPTQAEAITYAKELVRKQGGSIRIHSMKGQLRK